MKDYQSVFLKAAFNSILPEFLDSDMMDNDSVSPEFLAVLRKVADHYYKDDETTQSHIEKYERLGQDIKVRALRAGGVNDYLVNDFFNTGNFTSDFKNQGFSSDIKMMLGRFAVQRNNDGGYTVTDKYDFSSNTKFLKEYFPEISEAMIEKGVEAPSIQLLGASLFKARDNFKAGKGMVGTAYPIARTLAGFLMPDNEAPEEGGAQYIKFVIPPEDVVEDTRPSPRPRFFEEDDVEPVFPATAMDSERKELLDDAIAKLAGVA